MIALLTALGIAVGLYLYFTKLENRTFLANKFTQSMMSEKELDALDLKKQEDEFNAPDEDF